MCQEVGQYLKMCAFVCPEKKSFYCKYINIEHYVSYLQSATVYFKEKKEDFFFTDILGLEHCNGENTGEDCGNI